MKITSIEPQKNNPQRENIFLDNKFAFGISAELRFLSKLHINDTLTVSMVEKLINKDQVTRLVEKGLKFLSYRPRSEKEVSQHLLLKLKTKKENEDSDLELKNYKKAVSEAILFLKKHQQINDHDFALWWVEGRRRFKKTGDQILKSELFSKGISKEIIIKVLEENQVDPEKLALEAAKKKITSYQKLDPKEFKIKMGQYLLRKGFNWDVISSVVDTLTKKD